MAKLSDICTINMGQSPDSSTYNDNGIGLPFFQGNADFGDIHPKVRMWCSEPKKTANPKDILISVRAPIGAMNIADIECCIGRGLAALSVNSDRSIDKYVWYALESKVEYLISQGTGSTFKAIGKNVLFELDIPTPPLETQRQIAATLDQVTHTIDLCNALLEKLDLLVKARFVEMFGDIRLNPKGWKLYSFDELSDIITDGEHATPRRTTNGIYLLSARNVLNHAIQLDDVDYIDQEEYDRISKRIVPQEGDVLISCSGSVGRCCHVPAGLKFQMVRSAALVRFKKGLSPIFAEYMITSDYVQEQIEASKTASSQANLFQGKIAKLRGFMPPLDLQSQFAAFVEQTDKSKLAVQQVLEKAETLKKALMQEYFG